MNAGAFSCTCSLSFITPKSFFSSLYTCLFKIQIQKRKESTLHLIDHFKTFFLFFFNIATLKLFLIRILVLSLNLKKDMKIGFLELKALQHLNFVIKLCLISIIATLIFIRIAHFYSRWICNRNHQST